MQVEDCPALASCDRYKNGLRGQIMRVLSVAAGVTILAIAGVALMNTTMMGLGTNARIVVGKVVYAANCASCHGAKLEGQPDWQSPGEDGRLPAPPHNEAGHTWHHSDEQLLAIIRLGTAAVVGGDYQSNMPGFAEVLTDTEGEAVLDYIKSTWPKPEADYQRQISGG